MYVVKFEMKMPKNIEFSIGNDIRNKERMIKQWNNRFIQQSIVRLLFRLQDKINWKSWFCYRRWVRTDNNKQHPQQLQTQITILILQQSHPTVIVIKINWLFTKAVCDRSWWSSWSWWQSSHSTYCANIRDREMSVLLL